MPTIVQVARAPRARKRPGRTPESIAAWLATDPVTEQVTSLRDRPHLSYDPDSPHREEHARHLNLRSRRIVGVAEFNGYL